MQTNRRGFLGLIGAAFGALTLPRQAPATPAALPQPPAPSPTLGTASGATTAEYGICAERSDYWKPKHDVYQMIDGDNRPLGPVEYNHREEFHGPGEMLNIGGQYDGPIIIKSRTVRQHHNEPWPRVTIRATRYPKIL